MKWCCLGFENAYQSAGERTIAALIDEAFNNEPEFILQARAFDGIPPPPLHPPVPMSLVIEVGMQFCPWCGVSLQKWYGKNFRDLIRPGLRIDQGTDDETTK